MRNILIACVLALSASLCMAQTAAQVDAVAIAKSTLERLLSGNYAAILASADDKVRGALPEEKLRAVWETLQTQAGQYKSAGEPRVTRQGEYQGVVIPASFERAELELQVVVDKSGRIAGLFIKPGAAKNETPFTDAPYVKASAFAERDVVVDAGGWPLPGTLTMPTGDGPFPAVVLVHGSGPHDRDETIGPNKPFRDLARGLATRGVAVLRYEKRTRQHGPKIGSIKSLTVNDEAVDDAVAAVRLLQKTTGIDPKRVYVAGHSLGGTVAPRIAQAAEGSVAGLIIMAGAVRPLEQLLIDQMHYLAQADGTVSADEQKQLDAVKEFAAKLKELKAGDPPPTLAGLAAPTSYWLDLRGYNPAAAAKAVNVPMLILQGGRDYQVTNVDFEEWKAALGARKDVTFKLYPSLNHLFIAGTGKSLPAEYMTPGHVDEQVVQDIAEWTRAFVAR